MPVFLPLLPHPLTTHNLPYIFRTAIPNHHLSLHARPIHTIIQRYRAEMQEDKRLIEI